MKVKNSKTELCIQDLQTIISLRDQEMATSTMSYHARSNSFPSAPHPIITQVEDNLCRLRSSSEATSTSSSSITHQLNSLQDLHDCADQLLLLPSTQQASFDGLVDGSLRLLDVSNIIKEALSQTRESTQEIQSVLRRRCESQSEIKKYFSTRKMVQKTILKALKSLKDMGNKSSSDDETVALLGEAQAHTVLVFESLLSFINGKKSSSLSLVSKLVRPKRVSCEEEENEFAIVDASLKSLNHHKGSVVSVQNQLQKLDACIQDFEDIVESLFRRLLKTRVSLLNIINH